jgi:hypothetical protein
MAQKPVPPRAEDFDAIREAVMETARGRWFLDEYASRLRSAETARLATGMERIEKAVSANHDALMARLSEALAQKPRATPPEAPAPQPPQPDIGHRHMKFFRADEEIFEPSAEAGPSAEAKRKRRIVLIRHQPGEDFDVPMAEDLPPPAGDLAKAS